jgi:hypothetical protein
MSENVLGFMHYAMKKIIKIINLRQQEFTGNLSSRSQQNVSIYFIGLWHCRVSAWCHLTTIFWESRKYFLVFATSTDSQGL